MKQQATIILIHCFVIGAIAQPTTSGCPDQLIRPPGIVAHYELPPTKWFASLSCWHQNAKLEEVCNPINIRDQAVRIIKQQNRGALNLGQICDLFDYFATNWTDVGDPYRQEFFANAENSFTTMAGDCDDFAIVLATSIRAIGGLARITGGYHIEGGHAYAEVCIGTTSLVAIDRYLTNRYPANGHGYQYTVIEDKWGNRWLNLDSRHSSPGGPLFVAQSGFHFLLGHPEYCISF